MENYYRAIYQIIKTGHWITDSVSLELKEFEISEPQYNVLRILRGRKGAPITVEEISGHMIQRSSNVTRIIDKLLKRDLVTREECPTNRRKMDVKITDAGLGFLKQLDKRIDEFNKPMLNKLTEKELNTLTKLIIKLRN